MTSIENCHANQKRISKLTQHLRLHHYRSHPHNSSRERNLVVDLNHTPRAAFCLQAFFFPLALSVAALATMRLVVTQHTLVHMCSFLPVVRFHVVALLVLPVGKAKEIIVYILLLHSW